MTKMNTETRKINQALYIVIITFALIIGIILGLWQVKPPQVDETSLFYPAFLKMMANIERLAVEPHPSGSAEIERVRAELLAEIEAMGLTAIVEDASYTKPELVELFADLWSDLSPDELWELNKEWAMEEYGIDNIYDWFNHMVRLDGADSLVNILVKLEAPDTDRGIMFVAHYDSVAAGPGAADAMLPVCAMLEVMRLFAGSGELKNSLYFLFTDGEEMGLLGAWKFVEAHPGMKDKIDMVINLEMRGNSGGVILFETSPKDYRQMNAVLKSGAKPIGFSWAVAVYRMMPNNTDFTAFLNHGYQGINFAGIEGVEHYHMPTDNYENLNLNTAWHYLKTVLALADYAANNSLEDLRKPSGDAVFFPFLPGVTVLMAAWVSQVLGVIICLLAVSFMIIQIRRRNFKVSFSNIIMGALVLISALSAIWFSAGSYIFYIPLFAMVVTKSLKKWPAAHIAALALSITTALISGVPVIFLLWVSMVQPMM